MKKVLSLILTLTLLLVIGAAAHADTLTLPSGLKSIGEEAFAGDTSLDEVVIPEGTLRIGPRAFADSSVKRVSLPASLNEIADDAFAGADPTVTAEAGTYARWWAVTHGLAAGIAFPDYEAYNWTAVRAAFADNPDIGLSHDAYIRNYQLADYDEYAARFGGEPSWSVEFVGDSRGATIDLRIGEWVGPGARAIDVFIENEPTVPCTLNYRVTCTWDDESVTGEGALIYEAVEINVGIEAPDDIYGLRVGETESFRIAGEQALLRFGDPDPSVTTEMDCENWTDEGDRNVVCVTPHQMGAFAAALSVKYGNIRLEKWTWLFVEGAEGVVEGELSDRAKGILARNPNFAQLTARQLSVNGMTINEVYQDDGMKKPIIIAIHGGGGDKDGLFGSVCGAALRGFYGVTIDVAGCGGSDIGPIDAVNSWKLTVRQLDSLLDYYSANGQADVSRFGFNGISMGANLAFAYTAYGKYRPTAISVEKGTPDYMDLWDGPRYSAFDHGQFCDNVMTRDEIDESFRAFSPINHPERFENVLIYSGSGLEDDTRANGCMALKQYLDSVGGTKHRIYFFEGCTHDDELPGFNRDREIIEMLVRLAFRRPEMYNLAVPLAAFEDNDEIGLFHSDMLPSFEIAEYDVLVQRYGGQPEWSVEFVGDSLGAELHSQIAEWKKPGEAISLRIDNQPTVPCTLNFKVTCAWGDESITGNCALVYQTMELPTGIDLPDELHGLRVGEEFAFPICFLPVDFGGGYTDYWLDTEMDCERGKDQRDGKPVLCITPHEMGAFPAWCNMCLGNIQICKRIWMYVEGAPGVTEGELSPRAQELLAAKPEYAALTARQLTVNGVPLYEFYRDDGVKKPLVILIHGGGGGRKDGMVNNAIGCAMAGMYAVAIDAPGCGESDIGPIDAVNCWKLVISQIDSLIEYYGGVAQADADNFGMLGGSMGANISYAYVVHGKYRPVAIAAAKGTPDYRTLPPGVAGDVFDHGMAHQPLVMSVEEIIEKMEALLPINHPDAFLDLYIYAGNGLTDTTTGPEGCQALERYLDEAGGTKHSFHYYENCEHGDPMPGYDPIMALHDYLL